MCRGIETAIQSTQYGTICAQRGLKQTKSYQIKDYLIAYRSLVTSTVLGPRERHCITKDSFATAVAS